MIFSSKSIGYHYSCQLSKSKSISLLIDLLLDLINAMFNSKHIGILINRYIDGSNYIGVHSDDEHQYR